MKNTKKKLGDFPFLSGRLSPPSYHYLVPAHPQQAGDSGHDDDDDGHDDDDDDGDDDPHHNYVRSILCNFSRFLLEVNFFKFQFL